MNANALTATIMHEIARNAQLSHHLGALASQSLIAEAELTPKPGLVDRRGSGAHSDLSLELIRQSASVLEPYFSTMGFISAGRDLDRGLREELASIGRDAERAMYRATNGSNSHKGAIWGIGLLVAAAARGNHQNAEDIAATAGAIARFPDPAQLAVITHGDIVRIQYGAAGARGEATNNFPHVIECGLPTLRRQRGRGLSEEVSRLDALLSIMSRLDDTCVLYRGGVEALNLVKSGAQAVVRAGSSVYGREQMRKLERELIAKHISPGGSADLLAATIFLDAIERGQFKVHEDQGEWEEKDGAS